MRKKIYLIVSFCLMCLSIVYIAVSCAAEGGSSEGGGGGLSEGKGGSMARFAIKGDYLYTVSFDTMKVIDITDAANPKYYHQRDMMVGFDIETIFPMDTLLFIGARSGMYVYDITRPQFPTLLSRVTHITSCDPVVAQDNYAYVTLNTNVRGCGRVPNNVLLVYDISNPLKPIQKKELRLNGPTGLGVDGAKLFVCDFGLKQFDITNPLNIHQTGDVVEIEEVDVKAAYDVIPVNGILILVAKEGLFQFDYTEKDLKFVSKIETVKKSRR